jgi:hypothetical protein
MFFVEVSLVPQDAASNKRDNAAREWFMVRVDEGTNVGFWGVAGWQGQLAVGSWQCSGVVPVNSTLDPTNN